MTDQLPDRAHDQMSDDFRRALELVAVVAHGDAERVLDLMDLEGDDWPGLVLALAALVHRLRPTADAQSWDDVAGLWFEHALREHTLRREQRELL